MPEEVGGFMLQAFNILDKALEVCIDEIEKFNTVKERD